VAKKGGAVVAESRVFFLVVQYPQALARYLGGEASAPELGGAKRQERYHD
jgi:hypothetical protein